METQLPITVPLKQLLALSVPEKIALISAIWDSINHEDLPIPEWQLEELEHRAAGEKKEPVRDWEEVRQRIFDRDRDV